MHGAPASIAPIAPRSLVDVAWAVESVFVAVDVPSSLRSVVCAYADTSLLSSRTRSSASSSIVQPSRSTGPKRKLVVSVMRPLALPPPPTLEKD
eukprot:50182-Eustigmatos_ZCMA.PRE.1